MLKSICIGYVRQKIGTFMKYFRQLFSLLYEVKVLWLMYNHHANVRLSEVEVSIKGQ